MRSFFAILILSFGFAALANTTSPQVRCGLSYYERAAHWQDDVDIVNALFAVESIEKSDEIRGFRVDTRLVSVCSNGVTNPCLEEHQLHLRLSKGESEVESVNIVGDQATGPWNLKLRVGRFEEATVVCSGVGQSN